MELPVSLSDGQAQTIVQKDPLLVAGRLSIGGERVGIETENDFPFLTQAQPVSGDSRDISRVRLEQLELEIEVTTATLLDSSLMLELLFLAFQAIDLLHERPKGGQEHGAAREQDAEPEQMA